MYSLSPIICVGKKIDIDVLLRCQNTEYKMRISIRYSIANCGFTIFVFFQLVNNLGSVQSLRRYTQKDIAKLREETREMFQHAYDGYLLYASEYDELRPLTCDGVNTWGSYSLTLIDSLDTLAVMGNFSEFRRVVDLLVKKSNFDSDINVSVFETNIRIIGGLISAHLMQHRSGVQLEPGWPCNGPLLRLAEDVAKRLLPAFNTKTGMPYGTVNLKYGVPANETCITCTAGIGTFIIEFGALSRLTGDPIYEEVAMNAIYSLRKFMSEIGLYGNHIDVQTGRWTGVDSGIGAGVDSFYEYLVKGSIMLNRPELMEIFNEAKSGIDKYLSKNDWHIWASMTKGQVTIPVFQSLDAYWPGVLSMVGDISNAMKSIYNYHSVWKQYGFLPEFYNIPNSEAGANREGYPLRPELIESVMYLYRATGDSYLLEIGEDILRSIQHSAKTSCGFATIKNVRDHRKENRMESFFLAETTKYLYLLFDPDNFLNNDGKSGITIQTSHGECVIDSGAYIFNTEAHPIDSATLKCCHDIPYKNLISPDHSSSEYLGDIIKISDDSENVNRTINMKMNEQVSDDITLENLKKWLNLDDDKSELLKFLDDMKKTNITNDPTKYDKMSSFHESLLELSKLDSDVIQNITQDIGSVNNLKRLRTKQNTSDDIFYQNGQSIQTDTNISENSDARMESDVTTVKKQFNAQRLLEFIRESFDDTNISKNYELMGCKSQTFVQRLAVLGEILT